MSFYLKEKLLATSIFCNLLYLEDGIVISLLLHKYVAINR